MTAKAKKKKVKASKVDAVAKALAALERVEAENKIKAAENKKKKEAAAAERAAAADHPELPSAEVPDSIVAEFSGSALDEVKSQGDPDEKQKESAAAEVKSTAVEDELAVQKDEVHTQKGVQEVREEPVEEEQTNRRTGRKSLRPTSAPAFLPDAGDAEEPAATNASSSANGHMFDVLAGIDLTSKRRHEKRPTADIATGAKMDQIMQAFMSNEVIPGADLEPKVAAVSLEGDEDDKEDEDEGFGVHGRDDSSDSDDDDEPVVRRRKRRGEDQVAGLDLEEGLYSKGTVAVGLDKVAMTLGGRLILSDASWMVRTNERVALVGANGCGKTTQLKVLTSEYIPDEGEVVMSRPNLKICVLTQGFVDELDLGKTLKEELLSAVPKERAVLEELERIQDELADESVTDERKLEVTDRLVELQVAAEELRVYEIDDRIKRISKQVGFLQEDLDQTVALFSGGWKVRIGLSKIFMQAPDVLLLDEPTNHLDLESVEWLESFIQKQTLPIALVSHDREFMDRVCTRVVDTVEGMTYSYGGTYSEYLKMRDERFETWRKRYEVQEKKVTEMQLFIKQSKGKQAMANARNKKIAQLEKFCKSDDFLDPPPKHVRKIKFRFPDPPKARRGSGGVGTLAELQHVTHGYEGVDSLLLNEASLSIRPNDKVGIVGRNGAGKSTLLRLLMGTEAPSGGGKVFPPNMDKTGFFTQHQADLLPAEKTALQIVKEANQVDMDETELLEVMRKFRFRGDRLNIKAKELSGGERARLAIVSMMLVPSQLLIFDEPTNHLDVPMKETLEFSLREYQGAAVIVSHDRWFLSKVCRRIVAIEDGQVETYNGDFRYYMDKNDSIAQKVERRYIKGMGGIDTVPDTLAVKDKKKRGVLKKTALKKQKEMRSRARRR